MNKTAVIIILVLIGIVAAAGLLLAAALELLQILIGLVVWGIIVLLVYIFWKVKT